jgi:23S rRNA (cytidine1920-2'-O)/16S rRNA (cytidine1409-2'-O)-methyltransferase
LAVKRQRLDLLVVERGLAESVDQARRYIGAGEVRVDKQCCAKAGELVPVAAEILRAPAKRFVSRGGDKLASGLESLGIDPAGWVCVDVGSSTGGFTDCLLQRQARTVYCVDVGYGLLAWKLRQDARVIVLERTNARYLTRDHIPEPLDFAVIDASFISLEPLLPPLLPLFRDQIRILALVKPQFQLPKELLAGTGGVVEDAQAHQLALDMVRGFGQNLGLVCERVAASGIRGAKGNQEFFMLLSGVRCGMRPTEEYPQ